MHPTCYITLYGNHWDDDPLGVMINSSKGQAPFKRTKLLSMFAHKLYLDVETTNKMQNYKNQL